MRVSRGQEWRENPRQPEDGNVFKRQQPRRTLSLDNGEAGAKANLIWNHLELVVAHVEESQFGEVADFARETGELVSSQEET